MQRLYEQDAAGVRIVKIEVGTMENNVYVLSDASGDAWVIDGGYEPEAIAEAVAGLTVKGILVTHGHKDHHEHVAELRDLIKAPVGIAEGDVDRLFVTPDFLVRDGEQFVLGQHEMRAIHTPGHTPGSTCFLLEDRLFTGDTLVPGGPGNTSKDPARFAEIIRSVSERLFTLPAETVVCPGHGRDTTIGTEKPELPGWIERGW